ncbi:hypothetical protein CR513_48706, partial [Mucuna pruriens]
MRGLTAKTLKATNTVLDKKTIKRDKEGFSFSTMVMDIAKSTQASTSLTSADERAILPISVLTSLSSARILARTGNAATERTTPRNRIKNSANKAPNMKGNTMPAIARDTAFLPMRLNDDASIPTPTKNIK